MLQDPFVRDDLIAEKWIKEWAPVYSGGSLLQTIEALRPGVAPRTLYATRDSGELVQRARGLFRLAGLPPLRTIAFRRYAQRANSVV